MEVLNLVRPASARPRSAAVIVASMLLWSAASPLEPVARAATGQASVYAGKFAGRKTASGERYDPARLTAAHKTLPLGTRVRVRNLANGRSVVVRVNDRGKLARGRIIDLSPAAARAIGIDPRGVGRVEVERVDATAPIETEASRAAKSPQQPPGDAPGQ